MADPLKLSLRDPLDAVAVAEIWRRIEGRRAARGGRVFGVRAAMAGAALAAALVAVWVAASRPKDAPRAAQRQNAPLRWADAGLAAVSVSPGASEETFALSDGTRIVLAAGASLVPRVSTSERFEVAVERGRARFDVRPQGARRFEVVAGALRVEVVGTQFAVERREREVDVSVQHGRVRVHGPRLPSEGSFLNAGQSLAWRAEVASPARITPDPPKTDPSTKAAPDVAAPRAPAPDDSDVRWRAFAQTGDYAQAFSQLGEGGYARVVRDARDAGELLDLADVARAVGRTPLAVRALSRLLAAHAGDRRAPLAALTLARLYLEPPAEPNAAARALRRAGELGLPAALQEDALALQVEAHARAGDHVEARRFAEEYRRRFAAGRWRATVERWTEPP